MLIVGGSGLVGSTLIRYAQNEFNIHITINKNKSPFDNISYTKIDLITNKDKIFSLIKNINPDIIVHTVAHPSVDYCEIEQNLAKTLHVDVTHDILEASSNVGAKLIYLSTDAVFDGNTKTKYTEYDIPNPINFYGKTKLESENLVLSKSTQNVVLRPAVIYGWHKKSRFTNWIIESLSHENLVDPHVDQYNTPTLVDDLAKSIISIIKQDVSGLFHSTGKTCVNRYDLACIIAEIFGFNKNLIKPVTSNEKKQDAPRPKNTCLDSSKLEDAINFQFKDIQEGISFLHKKLLEGQPQFSDIQ